MQAMTPGVIQIPGDVSVGEAARLMHKEQVPCLLIKDTEAAVGIVTHADIVCKVVAQGLNPYDVEARVVMSMPVRFVEFDEPVDQITAAMTRAQVPLLIVTRNHHPIGFITARDLLAPPRRRESALRGSVKVYNERAEGTSYPAVLSRLGHFGAHVESEAPMAAGARITIAFSLPGSRRAIAAEATVLASPPVHGGGVTIQFTDVSPADQSEISSWIIRTRTSSNRP